MTIGRVCKGPLLKPEIRPYLHNHVNLPTETLKKETHIVGSRRQMGMTGKLGLHNQCFLCLTASFKIDNNSRRRSNHATCVDPECDQTFNTKGLRNIHYKRAHLTEPHGRERIYVCTHKDCGKAYSSPVSLASHEGAHTGDTQYKCEDPNCGRFFHPSCQACHAHTKPYWRGAFQVQI